MERRLTRMHSSVSSGKWDKARDSRSDRFRYSVWKYTTEKARPIEYGIGDFHCAQLAGGSTHLVSREG